ncbi:uncharacterized protein LOC103699407 isoform X2 [Phoenix dactylifera]|uniref:Uncharacterized protein LOC103699407 isoform X2 n=1 Tax=Phoenix dactylifera TaxID=42345 RepID=A0A8B8ZAI8_PHODC|nr:uncharacterized protein LOC103699407 isoform X2 [Phoenix dactylifera]
MNQIYGTKKSCSDPGRDKDGDGWMFPKEWTPPCGSCCTKKYANLVQIPWRVFCKKGCDTDGETWEECEGWLHMLSDSCVIQNYEVQSVAHTACIGECNEICYKDPVFKDHQWSAYIDRSPGHDNYSLDCFHACVSGCGFKFDTPPEKVDQVQPNRPPKPPTASKPRLAASNVKPTPTTDDLPCTSA